MIMVTPSLIPYLSSFILPPSSLIPHPSSLNRVFSMLFPWRLRTKTLAAGRIPRLMGVVNVTPDSFSDGGRFFEPAAAVEHGLRLAAEGADAGRRRPKHAARGRAGRGRGRTPPRVAGGRRLAPANGRADFDRHIQREGRRRVPRRRGGGNQRHHRPDFR